MPQAKTKRKPSPKPPKSTEVERTLPKAEVPPQVDSSVDRARQWAAELAVTDQATLATATSIAATIKEDFDAAEAARDALVRPLNTHVKFINDQFRPRTTGLKAALDKVKGKICDYALEQQRLAEVERQRMQAEADARAAAEELVTGNEVAAPEVRIETRVSAHTDRGSTSLSTRWDYEVTDLKALCAAIGRGELPTSLVEPAKGELRRMLNDPEQRVEQLRRQDAREPANGLRFFDESSVNVRRA